MGYWALRASTAWRYRSIAYSCKLHQTKVGNLRSEFGHARPSGSRVIRYVRDKRTDRQTDRRTDGQKQSLLPPSLRAAA